MNPETDEQGRADPGSEREKRELPDQAPPASIEFELKQTLCGIVTNANACLRMLAADPPKVESARETVRRALRDSNRALEIVAKLEALLGRGGRHDR
jgi:hypothetical protein